jgi:uncharacterized membrane protein YagU involved in acid resistance
MALVAGLLSNFCHPGHEVPLQAAPVLRQMEPSLCNWKSWVPAAIAVVAGLLSNISHPGHEVPLQAVPVLRQTEPSLCN